MKTIIAVMLCASLLGCDADYEDRTNKFSIPPELSDCKIYRMNDTGGNFITVVRCPYSATTTNHMVGKIRSSTTVL